MSDSNYDKIIQDLFSIPTEGIIIKKINEYYDKLGVSFLHDLPRSIANFQPGVSQLAETKSLIYKHCKEKLAEIESDKNLKRNSYRVGIKRYKLAIIALGISVFAILISIILYYFDKK